jgi:hypothetical protein
MPTGSQYTVVSNRPLVTAETLRAEDPLAAPIPADIRALYLPADGPITPRVRQLADTVAGPQPTTYDKVQAIEGWMGAHTTYSLQAPVPPAGADAVDHFLFEDKTGFCEQIASSLAVMLRSQGIPARVATGYAPGQRNPFTGEFVERASDAHAWVEVWFPATGWQAFDPTASVPLSGEVAKASVGGELASGLTGYVDGNSRELGLVMLVGIAGAGLVMLAFEFRRRHRRGRWGLLQDRFGALAARRGAPRGTTNGRRAEHWAAADDAAVAHAVADQLDRAAFDPTFDDDDSEYEETRRGVSQLARR